MIPAKAQNRTSFHSASANLKNVAPSCARTMPACPTFFKLSKSKASGKCSPVHDDNERTSREQDHWLGLTRQTALNQVDALEFGNWVYLTERQALLRFKFGVCAASQSLSLKSMFYS